MVGFRYVKKGVPQQNGAGVPSGDYAVMVGNTLFDVAVGLTIAVPTETHNPAPIDVLTPLRTSLLGYVSHTNEL